MKLGIWSVIVTDAVYLVWNRIFSLMFSSCLQVKIMVSKELFVCTNVMLLKGYDTTKIKIHKNLTAINYL